MQWSLFVLCSLRSVIGALLHASPTCSRRSFVGFTAAVALPSGSARAVESPLATATFSAGDPRFLQPIFDEIKYLGVKRVEVGSLVASDESSVRAVRIYYDPAKVPYKRIVGTVRVMAHRTSRPWASAVERGLRLASELRLRFSSGFCR